MTQTEKNFICTIMSAIENCYDENGLTVDEYYNNIRLPDLTNDELKALKKFSSYDI